MARGKHQQAKAIRDIKALRVRYQAASDELAVERERLAAAERDAGEVALIRQRTEAVCAERDSAIAGESERLRRDIEVLAELVTRFEGFDKRADGAWQDVVSAMTGRLGGGTEGFERFGRLIGVFGENSVFVDSPRKDLDGLAQQRIALARGERSSVNEDPYLKESSRHPGRSLIGTLRECWNEVFAANGVGLINADRPADPERAAELGGAEALARADTTADAVSQSTCDDLWLDAVYAWHPMPWINCSAPAELEHGVLALLGATAPDSAPAGDEAVFEAGRPTTLRFGPTVTARQRKVLSRAGAAETETAWAASLRGTAAAVAAVRRLPAPWASPPPYPQPGDAVAVRQWYALAALGAWARYDDGSGVLGGFADPAIGEVAAGLVCATPFWLPPGQTAGYANSLELSPTDRADLRLPYPQVLLTLADPILLPPSYVGPPDPSFEHRLRHLDIAAVQLGRRDASETTLPDFYSRIRDTRVTQSFPTLADVLAARGAMIEAVLLLADDHGIPSDLFAWCLAIPATSGGMLGRFALPGRRSKTAFGPQLDNLAAVCAWADWHPPIRELELPGHASNRDLAKLTSKSAFRDIERLGGAGGVRVLDVARTNATAQPKTSGSGAPVSPHTRRGHWRQQRYGPGNTLTKRIRIAPVVVNASRAGLAPRVYRLPISDLKQ